MVQDASMLAMFVERSMGPDETWERPMPETRGVTPRQAVRKCDTRVEGPAPVAPPVPAKVRNSDASHEAPRNCRRSVYVRIYVFVRSQLRTFDVRAYALSFAGGAAGPGHSTRVSHFRTV